MAERVRILEEDVHRVEKERAETAVALEKQSERVELLERALVEEERRGSDWAAAAATAKAEADDAIRRAGEAVARASRAEEAASVHAEEANQAYRQALADSESCRKEVRMAEEEARRTTVALAESCSEKVRVAEERARFAVADFRASEAYQEDLTQAGAYSYRLGRRDMFKEVQMNFLKIDFSRLKPAFEETEGVLGEPTGFSSSSSGEGGENVGEAVSVEAESGRNLVEGPSAEAVSGGEAPGGGASAGEEPPVEAQVDVVPADQDLAAGAPAGDYGS